MILGRRKEEKVRSGFTIIELSLSIAFIAILSITIVLIITDTISSYRRGLVLNQINSTGMELVSDMRSAIQNSSAQSPVKDCGNIYQDETACREDNAQNFVSVYKKATVQVGTESLENMPVYGAFCTGKYSYLWNSGYFFSDEGTVEVNSSIILKYSGSPEGGVSEFKLIKIEDNERAVCKVATTTPEGGYNAEKGEMNSNIDISNYGNVGNELIYGLPDESNLALYDLTVDPPAESDDNKVTFYSASFILGTVQGGINVKTSGNYCATPGGYNSDIENFDYCAINKFNFAGQAMGG
ncbi:hypothetical protein IIY24_00580 [Candidatus Saccharibacteria bacterium]|nr:hypothetical protein [Candidatus Saccharibacteria bacterium]